MFNDPGVFHALLLAIVVGALYALRKRLPGGGSAHVPEYPETLADRRRRRHLLALEGTELVLAGVFLIVGGAKLIGERDMVELFRSIGVGQWLRYVTGVFEVVGAAFMLVPLASGLSAVTLGAVMVAATLIELFVLRRPPIAAMACLSAHTYVAWKRPLRRPAAVPTIAALTSEPEPIETPTSEPASMLVETPTPSIPIEPTVIDVAREAESFNDRRSLPSILRATVGTT